jgi:Ca2+-binding RTX toxin-like protein
MLSRLFRRGSRSPVGRAPRPACRFRPALEALEGRALPSISISQNNNRLVQGDRSSEIITIRPNLLGNVDILDNSGHIFTYSGGGSPITIDGGGGDGNTLESFVLDESQEPLQLDVNIRDQGQGITLDNWTLPHDWRVTGPNTGTLGGFVTFNGVTDLRTRTPDHFFFSNGGRVDGSITVRDATGAVPAGAVIDCSACTTGVGVQLAHPYFGTVPNAVTGGLVYGVHTVYGGSGDDVLVGSDDADVLYGGGGNDVLVGGGGNDSLYGQAGSDLLVGGTGADVLVGGTGSDILLDGTTRYASPVLAAPDY